MDARIPLVTLQDLSLCQEYGIHFRRDAKNVKKKQAGLLNSSPGAQENSLYKKYGIQCDEKQYSDYSPHEISLCKEYGVRQDEHQAVAMDSSPDLLARMGGLSTWRRFIHPFFLGDTPFRLKLATNGITPLYLTVANAYFAEMARCSTTPHAHIECAVGGEFERDPYAAEAMAHALTYTRQNKTQWGAKKHYVLHVLYTHRAIVSLTFRNVMRDIHDNGVEVTAEDLDGVSVAAVLNGIL